MSIDGVDFEIQEPYPYDRKLSKVWYSHKFKGPGVRYEIGVCIKTGDIVWVQGPFPAGKHNDCTIFKKCLSFFLEDNERVEADDGYRAADPGKVKSKSGFSSRYSSFDHRNLSNTVRARHETANKRIKHFGSLTNVFRHKLVRHSDFLYAAIVLTQICFDMGEPFV